MLTSNKWIKKFVPDLNVTAKEFADKMTISGSKVESYRYLNKKFNNVVIGKILDIEKHPDADKLQICQVDIGLNKIQIVTAATNVFIGALVPVVLAGGFVDDGNGNKLSIKKGKLRGVESNGMFCSVHELGYGVDMFPKACDDGIFILDDDAKIGDKIDNYLGLDDFVTEYEITSNRTDCFGIYGLAREVAATFNLNLLSYPEYSFNSDSLEDYLSVEVESKLCRRYCAKIIRDVKIEPSPEWMQQLLRSVGIRPINNFVDITNYILTELGQPMHAFDYDKIQGKKIIVKESLNDSIITLDGEKRKLESPTLTINDINEPIAIAGIMGCENTKITDLSKMIVFESANFDGTNIRLSSKKLGLRSDSSAKFEKDIDSNVALIAINRACALVEELGCGKVVDGLIDIHGELTEKCNVEFSLDRCNQFLGTNVSKEEVLKYFKNLSIEYDFNNNFVTVPYFRHDLQCFEDIAEEVARFYGYDKIDTTLPNSATQGRLSDKMMLQNKLHSILSAYGYDEIMTYSFEGRSVFDRLLLAENSNYREVVQIKNPLGEEFSIMRTLPYNGILNSLRINVKNRNKDIQLYEFANTYTPIKDSILPDERILLTFAVESTNYDFFNLKGIIEEILESMNMIDKPLYVNDRDISYMHTGRQAKIYYNKTFIGEIGQIHPKVADNYNINYNSYIGYIDCRFLLSYLNSYSMYSPIGKFPSSSRDLCFILDKERSIIEIENIFDKNSKNILKKYSLFDVYEGDKLAKNKKSVTYNLLFRSVDRTLTDDEINLCIKKIIKELSKIDIELRQ